MKKITMTVMILSLSLVYNLNAQLRGGVSPKDQIAIQQKVDALFGAGKYEVLGTMNVDSAKNSDEALGVEDPYGTLKHCYIFAANGKVQDDGSFPKGFVGIYKDGNIIWHSPQIINGDASGDINAILDMDRDGKVDIVSYWEEGGHDEADYIWIFSWDGHQGTPLNLYDDKGHSNLLSYTDEVQYVDLKGDGVLEIEGKWKTNTIPAKEISVLYAWNGQNYVSVDTSSFGMGGVLPRNKVQAIVSATVTQANDSLYFLYVVENKKSSLQRIENFVLMTDKDAITNSVGRHGWDFIKDYYKPRIIWLDIPALYLLSQGEKDIFVIETKTDLPGINYFYMQGYNGHSDVDDIYTNSFHGSIISPTSPPNPLTTSVFLDTLVSYKHQCVTLGWLTNGSAHEKDEDDDKADEGIVERLDRRLDKAKAAIVKSDSVKARLELELFVKEVEQLYHKNKDEGLRKGVPSLTSEGYALLKYNAEYLIDRLPKRHGRGEDEKGKIER
jgi:hypothetical protein